jgi:hypothetical protein
MSHVLAISMTISNKLKNKLARWMDTFDAMDGCIDVLVGWLAYGF